MRFVIHYQDFREYSNVIKISADIQILKFYSNLIVKEMWN